MLAMRQQPAAVHIIDDTKQNRASTVRPIMACLFSALKSFMRLLPLLVGSSFHVGFQFPLVMQQGFDYQATTLTSADLQRSKPVHAIPVAPFKCCVDVPAELMLRDTTPTSAGPQGSHG